jgi:hypothetical protein
MSNTNTDDSSIDYELAAKSKGQREEVLYETLDFTLEYLHQGYPWVESEIKSSESDEELREFQALVTVGLNVYCDCLIAGVELDGDTIRYYNLDKADVSEEEVMAHDGAEEFLDEVLEERWDSLAVSTRLIS